MTHQLTVAELIAYLQTLPGEALVEHARWESCGYEGYVSFEKSIVYEGCTEASGLYYFTSTKTLQIGEN